MKVNITNENTTLCLPVLLKHFICITVTNYAKTNILNTYLKLPHIINIISTKIESNECIIPFKLWLKVNYSLQMQCPTC
jgi:hypothetical protein